MISVLILTKNEEQDLGRCLESLQWCHDIYVFDSFSTDNTTKIAIDAGVQVVQRIFDGYASQRNAALETLSFKNEWILILDADEIIPDELVLKMKDAIISASTLINGFRIRRRDYLFNTWLKHAQISPYYIRLIKKGKAHYHREINEVLQVQGGVQDIDGYFNHYPFSKGIKHWIDKHNIYSSMEAEQYIKEKQTKNKFSLQQAMFSKDFNERRYHLKGIYYKFPGRPLIKWLYMIFIRLSFLDGVAGITYATLQSIYEYFIVIKTKELLNKNNSGIN